MDNYDLIYIEIVAEDVIIVKNPENLLNDLARIIQTKEPGFCSFLQTYNEYSLFISFRNISDVVFYDQYLRYVALRIYGNKNCINQIGIVNEISGLFLNISNHIEGIPILYVNSYDSSYILFELKYKEQVLKIMHDNGYEV